MKRILLLLLLSLALPGTMSAQTSSGDGPRFRGADPKYFLSCLTAETEKVIAAGEIPAAELSPRVAFAFRIDSTGRISNFRFRDKHSEGRDRCELDPPTEATRRAVLEAFGRIEGEWTPGWVEGRAVDFTLPMTMRIPVEKIARMQQTDPLLFQGKMPDENFHAWVHERVRYDERFAQVGGLVHVRFWIEADGRITIDRIVETPDAKLGKEVVRVIRNSRGKWTPRKVCGVPQRTAYDYRVNCINEAY